MFYLTLGSLRLYGGMSVCAGDPLVCDISYTVTSSKSETYKETIKEKSTIQPYSIHKRIHVRPLRNISYTLTVPYCTAVSSILRILIIIRASPRLSACRRHRLPLQPARPGRSPVTTVRYGTVLALMYRSGQQAVRPVLIASCAEVICDARHTSPGESRIICSNERLVDRPRQNPWN